MVMGDTATSSPSIPSSAAAMAPAEAPESLSKQLVEKEEPEYVLRWGEHCGHLLALCRQLWAEAAFTDVTLATDTRSFAAHKLVLSACSPYFRQLFMASPAQHQTVFIKDIRSDHMLLLLEFMYRGCISVPAAQLPEILRSASSLHIRGLTETRDPALATGAGEQLGRYSPRPLIVDELGAGQRAEQGSSPLSDPDKFPEPLLETSSSEEEGRGWDTEARRLQRRLGEGRKSAAPRRLPAQSEEEDSDIAAEDSDLEADSEDQPMDCTKTALDTVSGAGLGPAARFSILGSYLGKGREEGGLAGSWLEPLAHLARSAPRPASRDSRGDSKDERETSGGEETDQTKPNLGASEGLDLASKLRSHFLANLPAQSYAWLNGIQAHTSPALAPAYRPGPPWLPAPPALESAGKLGGDKHPLGGIRTGEIGANGKPTVKCEVCGKKLADPSSLYRHRKIHSGDKPHKCPYCERRFIQRYNMKQHIKTHRIELMQDQKPGFTIGKKGRPAAILSHDLGPGLDMAN